jgi:P27 family predicted phage terminase small subunit
MPMPAKPLSLHALQGTTSVAKPKQPSNFVAGRPKPPAHLCKDALIEFKRVSKILGARKTETAGDFATLAVYAECYSRWVEAKRKLAAAGLEIEQTVLDSNGQPHTNLKINPLLRVVENCETKLLALVRALGLTPDTRDRVKPAQAETEKKTFAPGSIGFAYEEWKQAQRDMEAVGAN